MNYTAKKNLGLFIFIFTFQSTSTVSSSFDPKGSGKRFFGKIAAAR